jgi:hypothetical protein
MRVHPNLFKEGSVGGGANSYYVRASRPSDMTGQTCFNREQKRRDFGKRGTEVTLFHTYIDRLLPSREAASLVVEDGCE